MTTLILLLHGPNLNLLGEREPEVYGTDTLDDYVTFATRGGRAHQLTIEALQTNHEGELVEHIHHARGRCAAIIINPGAFTHYAWAIHDALAAFEGPVVEVHISNPNAREPWRHTSVIAPVATGSIMGFGKHGYDLAIRAVAAKLDRDERRSHRSSTPAEPTGSARGGGRTRPGRARRHRPHQHRWLTGFSGSNASLAVLPDRCVLVTDGRYGDRPRDELGAAGVDGEVVVGFTQSEQHARLVDAFAGGRFGRRRGASAVTHARWRGAREPTCPIVAADGLVEDGRRTKDAGELARIARRVPVRRRRARRGRADARRRHDRGRRPRPSSSTACACTVPTARATTRSSPADPNTPHGRTTVPTSRMIVDGDTVVIDVGALVDGYHSDMTRSFVIGSPSDSQQRDLRVAARDPARRTGRRRGRACPPKDVDAVCRAMSTEAGYGDWFLHSTGHGVGLLIHEDPFESPASTCSNCGSATS